MPEKKKEGDVKENRENVKNPVPPKPEKVEKPEPKPEMKKPPVQPPKTQETLVSFARWFRSKKFKPHWAAGMEAYTDTSRRRTMADWDRLFKNY